MHVLKDKIIRIKIHLTLARRKPIKIKLHEFFKFKMGKDDNYAIEI